MLSGHGQRGSGAGVIGVRTTGRENPLGLRRVLGAVRSTRTTHIADAVRPGRRPRRERDQHVLTRNTLDWAARAWTYAFLSEWSTRS